jgi:hypothetical protein
MRKPPIPKSPVPMLTEVVQVNGSLRPAVMPWTPSAPKKETGQPTHAHLMALASEDELLADKVIARVQKQLALMLPEMMRTAVDEVMNEQLAEIIKAESSPPT